MSPRWFTAVALAVVLHASRPAVAQTPAHPSIDRVAPREGPPGTRITIVGRGFCRGVATYLAGDAHPLRMRAHTPRRIVVVVPAGARTGLLVVTCGDEEESAGVFRVTGAPWRAGPAATLSRHPGAVHPRAP